MRTGIADDRTPCGHLRRATLALLGLAAAGVAVEPATTRPGTVVIESIRLVGSETAADLEVMASGSIDWHTDLDPSGNLSLELRGSYPGPGVNDLRTDRGLISSVTVVAIAEAGPDQTPITRLAINSRSATAHTVLAGARGLTVRFRPASVVQLPGNRYRTTAQPCLNLRQRPSLDGAVLRCLNPGTMVTRVDAIDGWSQLRLPDGSLAWASDRYLEASADLAAAAPDVADGAAAESSDLERPGDRQPQQATGAEQAERLGRRLADAEAERDRLTERLAQSANAVDELLATVERLEAERGDLAASLRRLESENRNLASRLAARRPPGSAGGDPAAASASGARSVETVPAAADDEPRPALPLLVPEEPLVWQQPPEGATPEPPLAVPEPPMGGVLAAPGPEPAAGVAEAVFDWAAAWADQRADDYLAAYSSEFQPPQGMSRSAWEAQRRLRVGAPRFIEVAVEELEVTLLATDRATARFRQRYRSDRLTDVVVKRLDLALRDGLWGIVAETVEP